MVGDEILCTSFIDLRIFEIENPLDTIAAIWYNSVK